MLLAWMLLGCDNSEEKTDDSAPPLSEGEDTAPTVCQDAAPVIDELTVEPYDGLYTFEGVDAPALTVSAAASDTDGDIDRMNLVMWWDDVVDGTVDTSSAGIESGYYQFDQDHCKGFSNHLGTIFEVDGNRFDYATAYEFAAVVYDDAGLVSEVAIQDGVTPNEDGSPAM